MVEGVRRYWNLLTFFTLIFFISNLNNKIIKKRISVGGKHLTNYLKEVISYRQLMVMDETFVINQVKEELCFVSTCFENDMRIAK